MMKVIAIIYLLIALISLAVCRNETEGEVEQTFRDILSPPEDNPFMEEEDGFVRRRWRSDSLDGDEEPFLERSELPYFNANVHRWPTNIELGHFSRLNNSYFLLTSVLARPSSIYRVVIYPFQTDSFSRPIDVRVSLSSLKGSDITFAESTALPGEITPLLMKLPDTLPTPYMRLRVEGTQNSNLLFVNTTLVYSSNDFLSIMVQVARSAFTGDQQVEFRVILLKMDLLPYQEPIDIFILDPTGYIVRRWVSRVPNTGVVDLDFFLPPIPAGGFWRIRVHAGSQRKEHPFMVNHYYIPRFELFFGIPAYTLVSEENVEVEISSAFTNDAPLYGNMTVNIYIKYPFTASDNEYRFITTRIYNYFPSEETIALPMTFFEPHVPQLAGSEIKFEAFVLDSFTGMAVDGYAKTRIITGDVEVTFPGATPVYFRPGMPFSLTVNVAYDDSNALDQETLEQSTLRVIPSVILANGGSRIINEIYIPTKAADRFEAAAFLNVNEYLSQNEVGNSSLDGYSDDWVQQVQFESLLSKETHYLTSRFTDYRKTGIFSFNVQMPPEAVSLTVSATFTDSEGNSVGNTMEGRINYSLGNYHIRITTSTDLGIVGEYAIFHIRSSFLMSQFHYLIICKGVIIHSATEVVPSPGTENVVTISVAISREMFPVFTLVAFHVDKHQNIAVDSVTLPVDIVDLVPASVYLNLHKDHSKSTMELFCTAVPGTFIFTSTSRQAAYELKPRNRLTRAVLLKSLLKLEPFRSTIVTVSRMSRNDGNPEQLTILAGNDVGGDAYRTLQLSSLLTLSDSRFAVLSPNRGQCPISLGYLECEDGTCIRYDQICNGFYDCSDGTDEMGCQYEYLPRNSSYEGISNQELYLMMRYSWWKDLFDTGDGSFGWQGKFIGHTRTEAITLGVPATQDDWTFDVFAINAELGFIFLPSMDFTSNPPFFIVLDAPAVCRRGEQISIRTAVFNSLNYNLIGMLILPESDDYLFVHVEENGVVEGYHPRTSKGEQQHLIFVPAEEIREIFIPIAIVLQRGTLEVTVRLTSQIAVFEETIEIEVKPEGAPVRKHTSVLLDLKSRSVFYEFMDIPIDESPIITNLILRRFLYGSPEVKLTLSGDVYGPIQDGIGVTAEEAFNGRSFKSGDGLAYNFGATLWNLHYLRLTNQLNIPDAVDTFAFLNIQMAGLLTRFNNGGFKMWHYSEASVWLTTWVTSLLNHAMLEDWENYIYVDPRILNDAVVFLMEHQTERGDFYETNTFNRSLDCKHRAMFNHYGGSRNISVSLTALVTYTLQEVLPALPGGTRPAVINSIRSAERFLERSLSYLTNPYDVAITSWALTVTGSTEKDVAIAMLLSTMRAKDGLFYWAKNDILSNQRNFENSQKNFILPREPQEWDADAIEATSYALLALLSREGVTIRSERIVNWLISIRDFDLAFAATVDSVVAFRALTEYCYRARLRDITDLKVEVEASSTRGYAQEILIKPPFVSAFRQLEIPNPWGHIMLTARGAGQALVQMTMTWGVDVRSFLEKPPRKYFDFVVSERHHPARNKSRITTTVCVKWLATDITPTSHAAMVEVEVPTGYSLYQPDANKAVRTIKRNNQFPELFDCLVTDTYIYFQFSYIPDYKQCFEYDLHRWFPVANLTFVRSAMITELFAPEHFEQIILNSSTLSALDICEVCGSFQCPYCPYYSAGMTIEINSILVSLMIFIVGLGSLLENRIFSVKCSIL